MGKYNSRKEIVFSLILQLEKQKDHPWGVQLFHWKIKKKKKGIFVFFFHPRWTRPPSDPRVRSDAHGNSLSFFLFLFKNLIRTESHVTLWEMLIILLPLLFDTEKNVCINFQRLPVQPLADEKWGGLEFFSLKLFGLDV